MSKHIKKSFQADPFAWIVGITIVIGCVWLLNVFCHHNKPTPMQPVDAVPVSE